MRKHLQHRFNENFENPSDLSLISRSIKLQHFLFILFFILAINEVTYRIYRLLCISIRMMLKNIVNSTSVCVVVCVN